MWGIMAAFKHGTTIHRNGGYPRLSVGPHRYRYIHVLVAEAMLGRELQKDEHVHHMNGDVRNPKWTNLLVITKGIHNAVSQRQYWYLKQKYTKEDAAWLAYFDVTGESASDAKKRQNEQILNARFDEVSFETQSM